MSWLTRNAIGMASITLHVRQYRSEDAAEDGAVHIDIDQTIVGGIKGTSEERTLNWQWRDHADHIFGAVRGRSRFVTAADVRAAEAEIPDAADREHLTAGWEKEDEELIESVAESKQNGWVARQIWGFQQVQVGANKERRYTRKVVVRKGEKAERIRLVYDWIPKA